MNLDKDELIIEMYESLQGSLKGEKPGMVHVLKKVTDDLYGEPGKDVGNSVLTRLSKLEDTKIFARGWIAGFGAVGVLLGYIVARYVLPK